MGTPKRTKRIIKRDDSADVMLVMGAFEAFIIEKQAENKAQSTIKNYKQSFQYFCEFNSITENTPTTELTQTLVYKWINTLKQEGVAISTINHYLRDVRVFLYWCMLPDRGYISPAYKIRALGEQQEGVKHFSDDDLLLLLEKPRKKDSFVVWRTWAIVNWCLATGNREATICEVKTTDIDFKRKEIKLRHTKNKEAQIIPLSSNLITVLKEYMRIFHPEDYKEQWLFPNVGGEQLSTGGCRQAFAKYCKDREVEQTNLHGLRHNFAIGWVKNNGNMFQLQKILGHSTLEMTRRYVRLYAEDIKKDFDDYSPLDTIKKKKSRTQRITRHD